MKKRLVVLCLCLCLAVASHGQYTYRLSWQQPQHHLYEVEMIVRPDTGLTTTFVSAVWRPGRYIRQDFAGAVSQVHATDEQGNALHCRLQGPGAWQVRHGAAREIHFRYKFFANNEDAGSSLLTEQQVYFNPVNMFLYVPGRLEEPVTLELPQLLPTWKSATALTPAGPGKYTAPDWHTFADAPSVFAPAMRQRHFESHGTTFWIHFQGEFTGDTLTEAAAEDAIRKICEAQYGVFGSYPFKEFHFIYRFLGSGMRHAVEHAYSVSFALPTSITAQPETIVNGLASITSHELWHAWNVKRIRPAALWPYNYENIQVTSLHWFTEGITDYYANLMVYKAGIKPASHFLNQVAQNIQKLQNSYAASVVSPAEASLNSWLDISPYKDPALRISYYDLGMRAGILIDLELIRRTEGRLTLDDVFRHLYQTWYLKGKGVPEDGIQEALELLSGSDWDSFFEAYIWGTAPAPWKDLFEGAGLTWTETTPETISLQSLGILRTEEVRQGLYVTSLHPAGAASLAGLAAQDLILEIDGRAVTGMKADTYLAELKKNETVTLSVFRNNSVFTLEVSPGTYWKPVACTLTPRQNPKPRQENLLHVWLRQGQ
ncbi:MAG: PDZ domain-containing protein [Bacteroidia bacterium]|nr:PDZ domain-containing protein [Bacteroidia bacterium]